MSEHTHVLEDGTIITHTHHHDEEQDEFREHVHADGTVHCHAHGGTPHKHEDKKALINRMSRAIGHMESIKTMIDTDRDATEILTQIAAVRSAINNIGKIILEEHIDQCIIDAVENDNRESLEDLNDAINKFVK